MDCKQEENLKSCNCTYEQCERKGLCCQCIDYHRRRGELPACVFTADVEATYDRSIARFVAEQLKRAFPVRRR